NIEVAESVVDAGSVVAVLIEGGVRRADRARWQRPCSETPGLQVVDLDLDKGLEDIVGLVQQPQSHILLIDMARVGIDLGVSIPDLRTDVREEAVLRLVVERDAR